MAIKNIEDILQNNLGGIKKIEFTTLDNADFSDASAVQTIPHRQHSAELSESGSQDSAGYAKPLDLSFKVNRRRDDVDDLIDSLANISIAVRITDNNEHITILAPARISHSYRLEAKPTGSNAYDVVISGISIPGIARARVVQYTDTPPIVGDDDVTGTPPVFLNTPPPEDESAAVPGDVPTVGDEAGSNNPCANIIITPQVTDDQLNANFQNLPDPYTLEIRLGTVVKATALPYTVTETGTYTIAVISTGVCEKVRDVYIEYVDPAADFTIEISVVGDDFVAVTDAANPGYLWEYEDESGTAVPFGTDATITPDQTGIYLLSITDGITKTVHRLFVDGELNVRITNLNEIANATGAIQVIENTTGNVFAIDFDPTRYVIDRDGVVMQYRAGTAASLLDANEYSVANGNLVLSSTFPLETDERVTINPV